MYIDSHYHLSYIVARMAGMQPSEASILAYGNQFIDSNNQEPTLPITGQSANFPLRRSILPITKEKGDWRNLDAIDVWDTWFMYHFIAPCNGGSNDPTKMVTTPCYTTPENGGNPAVTNQSAYFLINYAVAKQDIHTFSAACHMYLDTFSHQQFIGTKDDFNYPTVSGIYPDQSTIYEVTPPTQTLGEAGEQLDSDLLSDAYMGIGHVVAMDLPDRPTAKFSWTHFYPNSVPANLPQTQVRDNLPQWLSAFNGLYNHIRQFLNGGVGEDKWMTEQQLAQLQTALSGIEIINSPIYTSSEQLFSSGDLMSRCAYWLNLIRFGIASPVTTGDTIYFDGFSDYSGKLLFGGNLEATKDVDFHDFNPMGWYVDAVNSANQQSQTLVAPPMSNKYESPEYSDVAIGGLTFDADELKASDWGKWIAGISDIYEQLSTHYSANGIVRP